MQRPLKLGVFIAVIGLCAALTGMLIITKGSVVIMAQTFDVPAREVAVPDDPRTLARGKHLVDAVLGCAECHGADLGGKTLVHSSLFGTIASANITEPALVIDRARAIRRGVGTDGHGLWLMPATAYSALSDVDLGAVLAHLKSVPRVHAERQPLRLGPLGRLYVTTGRVHLIEATDEAGAAQPAPFMEPSATAAYGRYLAQIARCQNCHGPKLAGGRGNPTPSDLRSGVLGAWTQADFVRLMRAGKRPDGSAVDKAMPTRVFAQMNDLELSALWAHLQEL